MNKQYILDRIQPYLKNKSITEEQFNSLFSLLPLRQQYEVIKILIEEDIDILYEDTEEDYSEQKELLDNNRTYISSENMLRRLTNEELCCLYKQGHKWVLDVLVKKNEGLVRSRVLRCLKKYKNKLEFEDLYQLGMMGLLKAAERFEVNMETMFSTYAVWWIDQSILRGIMEQSSLIRIPVHYFEKIIKLLNVKNKNMYLSYDEIYNQYFALEMDKGKFNEILYIATCILDFVSLNELVGEEMDTERIELIEDDKMPSIEEQVEKKFMKKDIESILKTLKPREEKVIRLRFGLDDGIPRTLEEVGREFKVTRERIRQIEAKALKRLRHPSRSKKIRDYYGG